MIHLFKSEVWDSILIFSCMCKIKKKGTKQVNFAYVRIILFNFTTQVISFTPIWDYIYITMFDREDYSCDNII